MSEKGKGDSFASKKRASDTTSFEASTGTSEVQESTERQTPTAASQTTEGIVSSWEEHAEETETESQKEITTGSTAEESVKDLPPLVPTAGRGSQTASPSGARQVIAVSASKGPAAFFNLARKFLATDEICDLSALEGAIVSAVDAAHLLERSKLATIVRIQTSYVAVEPKRKKQAVASAPLSHASAAASRPVGGEVSSASTISHARAHKAQQAHTISDVSRVEGAAPGQGIEEDSKLPAIAGRTGKPSDPISGAASTVSTSEESREAQRVQRPAAVATSKATGRELRRARIIITVKRTPEYAQWLQENPTETGVSGDGREEEVETAATTSVAPQKG